MSPVVISKEFLDAMAALWLLKKREETFTYGETSDTYISLIYIYLLTESVRDGVEYWTRNRAYFVQGVYEDVCELAVDVTLREITSWLR